MSKEFLTKTEAVEKLGWGTKGSEFITKEELINWGSDINQLFHYENQHYPIDDHIQPFDSIPAYNRMFNVNIDFYLEFRGIGNVLEAEGVNKNDYIGEVGKVATIVQTHI